MEAIDLLKSYESKWHGRAVFHISGVDIEDLGDLWLLSTLNIFKPD